MHKQDLVQQLNKGFLCLSEKERLILTLFYYEDLTVDEITNVLDMSKSDVIILFNQAKIIMRKFTTVFDDIEKRCP